MFLPPTTRITQQKKMTGEVRDVLNNLMTVYIIYIYMIYIIYDLIIYI